MMKKTMIPFVLALAALVLSLFSSSCSGSGPTSSADDMRGTSPHLTGFSYAMTVGNIETELGLLSGTAQQRYTAFRNLWTPVTETQVLAWGHFPTLPTNLQGADDATLAGYLFSDPGTYHPTNPSGITPLECPYERDYYPY